VSRLVKNSATNSSFVQKERNSSITLKGNFTMIHVNFILMFKSNFILTCYILIFLKARFDNTKRRKIFELLL
jgi:hypothetical protein